MGLPLIRGVLGIAVFAPEGDGAMGDESTGVRAAGSALSAVAATGLPHLLILATPRPATFFAGVVTLATAVMVLLPFTTSATPAARQARRRCTSPSASRSGACCPRRGRSSMGKAY
ncbi:hypothetical protein ACFV6Z_02475 [Streptomyces sp. NPDC059818]|uniref:hypothetical protein n=1 Tax=Streptomyces sp. NPDC059818 TaxID=3346962 RepID=UPI00366181DC